MSIQMVYFPQTISLKKLLSQFRKDARSSPFPVLAVCAPQQWKTLWKTRVGDARSEPARHRAVHPDRPGVIIYRATVKPPDNLHQAVDHRDSMSRTTDPIYECACHEGNYGLAGHVVR